MDLFEIKSVTIEGVKVLATLAINAQSDIYKAHFPNNPITPGVTEIHFARKILETAFPNKKFIFQFSKQIKFVEVLRPEVNEVFVTIDTHFEAEKLIADVEISRDASTSSTNKTIFLKAKLSYKISE